MATYNHIRLIGFAIPTTPADIVAIGDPNGSGAVAGYYLGNEDFAKDIQSRIDIMKSAVDTAKAQLTNNENGVINLFVAPEFYFHGLSGPYIFSEEANDPIIALREKLAETFNAEDYPHWMFVCGSVISTQIKDPDKLFASQSAKTRNNVVRSLSQEWKNSFGPLKGVIFDMLINFIKVCHSYPNCLVRNRSVIINNMGICSPQKDNYTQLMTTEKYYVSNEDFLLYDTKLNQNVITEQMTTYPHIDLSAGDFKQSAFDHYAIFRQKIKGEKVNFIDYGVEICLDHNDTRLRGNINNESSPIASLHLQIIPSCGMQIMASGVATGDGGIVFNCDGQYSFNEKASGSGNLNGVDCVYANYVNGVYQAHTQLARVEKAAIGKHPDAEGASDATFQSLSADIVQRFPVINLPIDINDYYAGGAGEVHIYGLHKPLTLYP